MAAAAAVVCSVCFDEDETIVFNCSNRECTYQLCTQCIKEAFKDSSGAHSSNCQMCHAPSAMGMISAVLGRGAIRAVEQDVRSSIEFELKVEMDKKERAKKDLVETNVKARKIFNDLAEKINLNCPRCKTAFTDYDGCNALTCGVPTCRAGFCAICLKDCGTDAHGHVSSSHGSYFDKEAFERSKVQRSKAIVDNTMKDLSNESDELRQLVLNHVEKAGLTGGASKADGARARRAAFLMETREGLLRATKDDRLSLMSSPEDYDPTIKLLSKEDISPRSTIPVELRLKLVRQGDSIYSIVLERSVIEMEDIWTRIPIKNAAKSKELSDIPNLDSIANLSQAIKCAVIAFEGHSALYQTRRARPPQGLELLEDQICISLQRISRDGGIGDGEQGFVFDREVRVIGLNQNLRMILLEEHITKSSDEELIFPTLKHLIGRDAYCCLDRNPAPHSGFSDQSKPGTAESCPSTQAEDCHGGRRSTGDRKNQDNRRTCLCFT